MGIRVICKYASGDYSMETVNDSLIMTEDEAVRRGFSELNRRYKVKHIYEFTIPYPEDGHLIRPGGHVRVTCPEEGLIARDLYIAGATFTGEEAGVMVKLTCEGYEWEGDTKVLGEETYGWGLFGVGYYGSGSSSVV